jgi:hypothetical protein
MPEITQPTTEHAEQDQHARGPQAHWRLADHAAEIRLQLRRITPGEPQTAEPREQSDRFAHEAAEHTQEHRCEQHADDQVVSSIHRAGRYHREGSQEHRSWTIVSQFERADSNSATHALTNSVVTDARRSSRPPT